MAWTNPFASPDFVHVVGSKDIEGSLRLVEFPGGFCCYSHTSIEETEFIYNEIFVRKEYVNEGLTLDRCKCIVDAGANIGMFSLFALLTNRNAVVYAFEPMRKTYEILVRNLEYHHLSNAHTYNVALGKEDNSRRTFNYYPNLAGHSTAHPEGHDAERQEVEQAFGKQRTDWAFTSEVQIANVRTLSSIIKENNIKAIDFLKVDTEGDELCVLSGILPQQYENIGQLCIEVHSEALSKEVQRLLSKLGYRVSLMEGIAPGETQNVYAKRQR